MPYNAFLCGLDARGGVTGTTEQTLPNASKCTVCFRLTVSPGCDYEAGIVSHGSHKYFTLFCQNCRFDSV